MTYAKQMAESNPTGPAMDSDLLAECIEACFDCAQSCTACADACLGEDSVAHLVKCIGLNLNCADICVTTGRMLSRQTAFDSTVTQAMLEACIQACRVCGDECESHAGMHEHCEVCAEACRRCEEACQSLLAEMGSEGL